MKSLKGAVAVVTGGASGIGRACCLELARQGADIAVVDLSETAAEDVAGEVRALGRVASIHIADVADQERMRALPEEVEAAHGKVNILINNAGVCVVAPFEQQSEEDLEWIIGINVWGVVYGCKFFLPLIRRSGEGQIVNISSLAGYYPVPGLTSYVASKHAVRGFSESLRAELVGSGIGVTCVHPGAIATNIPNAARYAGVKENTQRQGSAAMSRYAGSPENAARRIARGIRRNQARILIGPDARLLDLLVRASPSLTLNLTNRLYAMAAKKSR